MPILNIEPVKRSGMRLLISLYGLSETGKTKSGLRLAAGIQTNPAKRMLLDTEGGQRGRAYSDEIPGGYLYASLTPPFTPERYIEAIAEIERAGVTVLVVDSISHAWFAEGGILDMVEVATEKNDMAKWAKPKRRLGKMTRRMMSSDMHIILCSRAKQPLIEEIVDGRKKLTPGPVVPVQEKTLRYDMTIMAHMLGDGAFSVDRKDGGKCPGALRPLFASRKMMDEDLGKALVAWIGGEDSKTGAVRSLERDATEAAEAGSDKFRAFWKGCSADDRAILKPQIDNYQSIAAAADEEAKRATERAAQEQEEDDDPFPMSPPSSPIVILPAGFWDRDDYALDAAQFESACRDCPGLDALLKLDEDNAGLLKAQPELRKHLADRQRDLAREAA